MLLIRFQNPMTEIDMDKPIDIKMELMDLNIAGIRKSPEKIQQERQMAIAAMQAKGNGGSNPAMPTPELPGSLWTGQ